jgi:hypothetical protein
MSDTIRNTIAELKRQIAEQVAAIKADPKLVEILKLHQAVNTLENLLSERQTPLSEAFGLDSGTPTVKPGEFFGLTPLDAAKSYLKRRGEAREFKDIVAAIRMGGVPIAVSEEDQLRVSLGRSTLEVAKIADDLYGLLEFYPHVKRGGKAKRQTPQLVGLQPSHPEPQVGTESGAETNGDDGSDSEPEKVS